jgi:hypothetical protein
MDAKVDCDSTKNKNGKDCSTHWKSEKQKYYCPEKIWRKDTHLENLSVEGTGNGRLRSGNI